MYPVLNDTMTEIQQAWILILALSLINLPVLQGYSAVHWSTEGAETTHKPIASALLTCQEGHGYLHWV
jgi:hypothetical protein